MIFINAIYKEDILPTEYAKGLLKLLNPVVPHITEELWNKVFKEKDTIAYSKWPCYDSSKLIDDTYELVVQVNGKLRGKIEANSDTTEEKMKELALSIENVKIHTEGKEIVKIVVIPKKLVNIVVK